MRQKALRVVLVLVVLGALAAIPASTQMSPGGSKAAADRAGTHLPLLLVVNRLELSKTQMETLRTTIGGMLDEQAALETKRASFEAEMIAFNGTAEELDGRIAAFRAEMDAARGGLREKASAAVDTMKETLSMKQGEILLESFPMLRARFRAALAPERETVQERVGMIRGNGVNAAVAGTEPAGIKSRQATAAVVASSAGAIAERITVAAERIRERIAGRIEDGAKADDTMPAMPMAGRGIQGDAGMLGSVQVPGSGRQATVTGDFGTMTIALDGEASGIDGALPNAAAPVVRWFEQLFEVLELKLAAMS